MSEETSKGCAFTNCYLTHLRVAALHVAAIDFLAHVTEDTSSIAFVKIFYTAPVRISGADCWVTVFLQANSCWAVYWKACGRNTRFHVLITHIVYWIAFITKSVPKKVLFIINAISTWALLTQSYYAWIEKYCVNNGTS